MSKLIGKAWYTGRTGSRFLYNRLISISVASIILTSRKLACAGGSNYVLYRSLQLDFVRQLSLETVDHRRPLKIWRKVIKMYITDKIVFMSLILCSGNDSCIEASDRCLHNTGRRKYHCWYASSVSLREFLLSVTRSSFAIFVNCAKICESISYKNDLDI